MELEDEKLSHLFGEDGDELLYEMELCVGLYARVIKRCVSVRSFLWLLSDLAFGGLCLAMKGEGRIVVVIVNVESEGDGVHASEDSHSADNGLLGALEERGDFGNGGVLLEVGDEEGVVFGSPEGALFGGGVGAYGFCHLRWTLGGSLVTG